VPVMMATFPSSLRGIQRDHRRCCRAFASLNP
jgi:hypothetical protein